MELQEERDTLREAGSALQKNNMQSFPFVLSILPAQDLPSLLTWQTLIHPSKPSQASAPPGQCFRTAPPAASSLFCAASRLPSVLCSESTDHNNHHHVFLPHQPRARACSGPRSGLAHTEPSPDRMVPTSLHPGSEKGRSFHS